MLSVLTPDNIHQIKPLKILGRGQIQATAWLDENTLAVASFLALWHYTPDGAEREVQRFQEKLTLWVSEFKFFKNRLVIWNGEDTFFVYDAYNGSKLSSISVPPVNSFAFELNDDQLMTFGNGWTQVYDLETGSLINQISGKMVSQTGQTTSPDVTVGDYFNDLTLPTRKIFYGHSMPISRLYFEGDRLISVDISRCSYLWNLATGDIENVFQGGSGEMPVYLTNAAYIVATYGGEFEPGFIWVRRLSTGEALPSRENIFPLMLHNQQLLCCHEMSALIGQVYDQTHLLSPDEPAHIFFLDLETDDETLVLSLAAGDHIHIHHRYYVRSAAEQALSVFEFETHRLLYTIYPVYEQIRYMLFSPDSRHFLTMTHQRNRNFALEVWETKTGKRVMVENYLDAPQAYFSPDSALVVIKTGLIVMLWNLKTYQTHGQFTVEGLSSLLFNPDGKLFAAFYKQSSRIELWEIASVTNIMELKTGKQEIGAVAFSPDGKWLAVGNRDGTIALWGVENG